MNKIRCIMSAAVMLGMLAAVSGPVVAADEATLKEGKELAFNNKKAANCLVTLAHHLSQ